MISCLAVCQTQPTDGNNPSQFLLGSTRTLNPIDPIFKSFEAGRRQRVGDGILEEIATKLPKFSEDETTRQKPAEVLQKPGVIKTNAQKIDALVKVLKEGDQNWEEGDPAWRKPKHNSDPDLSPMWQPFNHRSQHFRAYCFYPGMLRGPEFEYFFAMIPRCLKCRLLYDFNISDRERDASEQKAEWNWPPGCAEDLMHAKLRTLFPEQV